MPNKLYPPYLESSLPAFYLKYDSTKTVILGADLTIPFSMNDAVSGEQVKAFVLRLRTVSSGSYLFPPIFSTAFSLVNNTVTFNLTKIQAEQLNEGQFYKVQIAYCGSAEIDMFDQAIGDNVGYFSTVGIIKCTSQPQIYINNLNANSVNFFSNDFIGVYDQINCKDQSEKVYSYEFIVYDENDNIYFSTGEKLHQTIYDINYNQSIDKVSINDFVASGVTYSIQYKVTTMNNLVLSSLKYKITNENLVSPNQPIEILPKATEDSGYIQINFKGNLDLDKSWYYILDKDKIKDDEIKPLLDVIKRYENQLDFLKYNSLFKYYDGTQYRYMWNTNDISGFKKILKNNIYYYVAEEESSYDNINEYSSYYELIILGKDLIRSISYEEAERQYAYVNKIEHIFRVNNGEQQYLLDASPYEALYYGSYILSRSSDKDNYSTWSVINRFRLDGQRPSSYSINDITVEHGRKYRYSLQQYNIWGLVSSRILSDEVYATFEDMYLYDGDKILKIRYNPKVDSFKINVLEQKTDTIGGQFPYITRNGATWYRQFPIGGLIAQELDVDECFINRDYGLAHRHTTSVVQDKYNTNGELIQKADIPNNALRDFHAFTDENILLEREFKNAILEWLNNGNAKLFKSPYEGNYIVRLMQNTLTPINELGRMLHNFTSQAYEIAECNYSNLVKYGFIKTVPPSDYSGLWKTYNLTDKDLINSDGDIEIKFDVGLNSFTVQDMMPGDIIYLLYSDSSVWEPIMIGITGSYTYTGSDRNIVKLKIHPQSEISQTSNRNISGIIDCFYQGVRITAFDGIIGQQLITIPSQQYVGVNPFVENIKKTNWSNKTNDDQYSFSVSNKQYRELQNYNVKDFINDNLSQDSSGISYKVNDDFIRNIATFEPGDILQRINTTLNHGDSYKIDLLNIEQAKFRLREVIPVYVLENSHKYNGNYQMIGEQILDGRIPSGNCLVSTSPYGYPHRIEELVEFEMLDPYCIFEVFEIGENGNWQPISSTKGRPTQYYDPFYRTWLLYDYNPTFQINYIWKKVIFNPQEKNIKAKQQALVDKANGLAYNEDLIYDYELKKIDENTCYYENNLNDKIYIKQDNDAWFTLYEKYNGQYYAYGYHKEPSFKNGDIYFVKEYETNINLLTVKEKEYKNLKNINSIKIGNGIMAELTFQIKVIDYYTEIINEDVKQAKEDYLAKKNFYSNLMKNYSIVYKADYLKNKSSALANAYDKLINGTNGSFLFSGDREIIKKLLKNQYEVDQLNFLSLYNVETINNELPNTLIEKLSNYKIANGKLDLTTIQIFQAISPDNDQLMENMFFIANENNIKYPTIAVYKENGDYENDIPLINKDTEEIYYYFKSLPQIYRKNNVDDDIIFAVDKKTILDLYKKETGISFLLEDDIQILYADNYNKENIRDVVQPKTLAYLNDGSNIGRLNKYNFDLTDNLYTSINDKSTIFPGETYYIIDENNKYKQTEYKEDSSNQYYIKNNGITIKEWYLLTKEDKENIKNLSNFVSIEKVDFIEERITPLPFYEEKELETLSSDTSAKIDGVQKKLEDLTSQINQINEEINTLTDQITIEKNEYINLLSTLKEEIEEHNQKVLYNWACNEIRRLADNDDSSKNQTLNQIKNYISGSQEVIQTEKDEIINKIIRYLISCDNLYDMILQNIKDIEVLEGIKADATNNQNDLQELYKQLIEEKSGDILIYYIAFQNAIYQVAQQIMTEGTNETFYLKGEEEYSDDYKNYLSQLENKVIKYQNVTQEIIKNDRNSIFSKSLIEKLKKMKEEYFDLYEKEYDSIIKSQTYVSIENFSKLVNLYDDLEFIKDYIEKKFFIAFGEKNNSNIISIEISLESNWNKGNNQNEENSWNKFTSSLLSILSDEWNSLGESEEEKIQYISPQIKSDSVKKISLYEMLLRCTRTQIQRIIELKDLYVYSYRTPLNIVIYQQNENEPNAEMYNTFIFYPLVETIKDPRLDNILKENNQPYLNNKEYYNTLSEEEKIQVLQTSAQLTNFILEIIDDIQDRNIYKELSGQELSQYIKEKYLDEDREYNCDLLNKDRDKIINPNENNNFTKFNDKIISAKNKLEVNNDVIFTFYPEEDPKDTGGNLIFDDDCLLFRKKYLVNSKLSVHISKKSINEETGQIESDIEDSTENLPKIISYYKTKLKQLSDIEINESTGEVIITDGIFKDYIDQIGGENSLLLNKKILKQAQALLKLYQQQYNNYLVKFERYTKEAAEQEAIYSSYNATSDGQEVLNYYNKNNEKTLEEYRMDVKEAWWKFLNLLDDRYTEEKERGMYI